jgi:hypothetical protein
LGASVEVSCARLTAAGRAELQARARLLLIGAGLDAAKVRVECGPSTAQLVWVDGSSSSIDEGSGLVEGTLDAIETRIADAKKAAAAKTAPSAPAAVAAPAVVEPPPASEPARAAPDVGSSRGPAAPESASPRDSAEPELEGGVALASVMEYWPGSIIVGPRLDVGLATGRRIAFVISEGTRFGFGSPDLGQLMVFDLQAGAAFGAPYQGRTAVGVVLLFGSERLAVSSSRFAAGGVWTWSATASLGLRGSVAMGPLDAWFGIDGLLRSTTIGTDGPAGVAIPTFSGLISVGAFLPAFARRRVAPSPSARAEEVAPPWR